MKKNKKVVVKKSSIKNAGLGVFAVSEIKKDEKLGEYLGKILTPDQYVKLENKTYGFQVSKNGKPIHFINGNRKLWPSLINGAKTKKQMQMVNVFAYQYRKKIFIKSLCTIKPGEELILNYGKSYWL
jgi:uncharacterized protein